MPRRWRKLFGCVAFTFGLADPAAAHGFGQRYDLPIPLSSFRTLDSQFRILVTAGR